MTVVLRKATMEDVSLLTYWDTKAHVIAASGSDDPEDWAEAIAADPDWASCLIAESDGRPVGVVQIIDPRVEESHYWGEIEPNLRAIDIWIGEESDLGHGLGTVMMSQALDLCFSEPDVTGVVIDPLESNAAARRFYERLGYRAVGPKRFGSDACMVYRIERATWAAHGGRSE